MSDIADAFAYACRSVVDSTSLKAMAQYARIGSLTERTGPILTDEPRVIRRIGYAVHRYIVNTDPKVHGARYVLELHEDGVGYSLLGSRGLSKAATDHNDWTWFRGEKGYSTIYECLAHGLNVFVEDLYVDMDPNRVNDVGGHYANVSRYPSRHGVNSSTAVRAIITDLLDYGAIAELAPEVVGGVGPYMVDRLRWGICVPVLDSWVASCMMQLPSDEERIDR